MCIFGSKTQFHSFFPQLVVHSAKPQSKRLTNVPINDTCKQMTRLASGAWGNDPNPTSKLVKATPHTTVLLGSHYLFSSYVWMNKVLGCYGLLVCLEMTLPHLTSFSISKKPQGFMKSWGVKGELEQWDNEWAFSPSRHAPKIASFSHWKPEWKHFLMGQCCHRVAQRRKQQLVALRFD